MKKHYLILLLAVACCIPALAQEMPAAQKNLLQFDGKWVSKNPSINIAGTMHPGVYTFDCSVVNKNTGILAHERFTGGDIDLWGENLLGYDPNLQQVHLYSIDNTGTAHDHYGYWTNDHTLYVQYQGVVEGKMYVEQITMAFSGTNTMTVKLVGMYNGELVEKIDATFTKE